MNGINKNIILSFCIPTWNRCDILKQSLSILNEQLNDIDNYNLEIIVSDNGSTDNTEQIVKNYIVNGMPIIYNRNSINIGDEKNFLKCIQMSKGKYIWLVGDDDFLDNGALKYIIDILKQGDYGLINLHLKKKSNKCNFEIFNSKESFLKVVSYSLTFISSNIFNRKIVNDVYMPEQYIGTHLLQVPFYLRSALSQENNVIIYKKVMTVDVDATNNGGYNFFEVFVQSYFTILHSFVDDGLMTNSFYNWHKKNRWLTFVLRCTYNFLIKSKFNSEIMKNENSRGGFNAVNGWKIIFKFYSKNIYFYFSFFRIVVWFTNDILKGIMKEFKRFL